MKERSKIAVGGGCHWCTEAVFQALEGVLKVEQGYISSYGTAASFSEGIIVHFEPAEIPLDRLIEIHLHTHKSTSAHSFRDKYRSAIYFFKDEEESRIHEILSGIQTEFEEKIITQVFPFREFKASRQSIQDYYRSNPEKPFCQRYIAPKLQFLLKHYGENLKGSPKDELRPPPPGSPTADQ